MLVRYYITCVQCMLSFVFYHVILTQLGETAKQCSVHFFFFKVRPKIFKKGSKGFFACFVWFIKFHRLWGISMLHLMLDVYLRFFCGMKQNSRFPKYSGPRVRSPISLLPYNTKKGSSIMGDHQFAKLKYLIWK